MYTADWRAKILNMHFVQNFQKTFHGPFNKEPITQASLSMIWSQLMEKNASTIMTNEAPEADKVFMLLQHNTNVHRALTTATTSRSVTILS